MNACIEDSALGLLVLLPLLQGTLGAQTREILGIPGDWKMSSERGLARGGSI